MAARVVTGTILKSTGGAWKGAEVRFALLDDAFTVTPARTYPVEPVIAVTDATGAFSVTLMGGLDKAYRVTLPDGNWFDIVVPDGTATTLETLRAAYAGVPAVAGNTVTVVGAMFLDTASVDFTFDGTNITAVVLPAGVAHQSLSGAGANAHAAIDSHIASVANPHTVTKAQVGLGSADNTSDVGKPVSTAQQAALNLKAPLAAPVFTGQPTIADLTLMAHGHITAASGGALSAAAITSGLLAAARIATGTPNGTLFLRDDQVWAAPTATASITVQEGDVTVDAAVTILDFDASDFNVTSAPAGEANLSLAYGVVAGTPAEGHLPGIVQIVEAVSDGGATVLSTASLTVFSTFLSTAIVLLAGTWDVLAFADLGFQQSAASSGAEARVVVGINNGATFGAFITNAAGNDSLHPYYRGSITSDGVAATTIKAEYHAKVGGTAYARQGRIIALCKRTA